MATLLAPEALTALLAEAGCVAAEEEAGELLARAAGDGELLGSLVRRRVSGEPLAWVTGRTSFCGLEVHLQPGVYVPRWQTEPLARRAAERLPRKGRAIDLCTGAGAVAAVLASSRPHARVVAGDIDERAVSCALRNGVDAYESDLFSGLPAGLGGMVDVVIGVVPYVPTAELVRLPRDTLQFESARSYDGGPDGTDVLLRAVRESCGFLRPGGALFLEIGGEQAEALRVELRRSGYDEVVVLADEDGDVRGLEASFGGRH